MATRLTFRWASPEDLMLLAMEHAARKGRKVVRVLPRESDHFITYLTDRLEQVIVFDRELPAFYRRKLHEEMERRHREWDAGRLMDRREARPQHGPMNLA